MYVIGIITSLSWLLMAACRRHIADWGWWSTAGVGFLLGGEVLYLVAVLKWSGVYVRRWWIVLGYLSVLLLANGMLMAHEYALHGAVRLLPPVGFVGGFWLLCAVVRLIFRRMTRCPSNTSDMKDASSDKTRSS
jgi:hypothetical protein